MTDDLIQEAERLGGRVILFGSCASGEACSDRDVDLLVIEPKLKRRRADYWASRSSW